MLVDMAAYRGHRGVGRMAGEEFTWPGAAPSSAPGLETGVGSDTAYNQVG